MAQAGGHLWVSGQPGVPCGVVSAGGAGPPLRDTVLRGPQPLTAPPPLAHSPPPLPPPAPALCSPPPQLQLCAGALPQGRPREPQGVLRAQWGRTQAPGQCPGEVPEVLPAPW